ncbi:formate dehydrogenase subunit delta [Rhodoferax sp.]|uniref:formate dehydrogenase subunit delta n=1 Tax=Rhodoferax sp. TaxID=50421 RepID=UPI0025F1431D|nr:formate dehydrogenase subunit delta [Rhodoferax sp.]
MKADNLIRMANQIGEFFETMPEREEALDDIATHIRKFWEPRMRRALLAALDTDEAQGMREIVLAALRKHRADLQPAM